MTSRERFLKYWAERPEGATYDDRAEAYCAWVESERQCLEMAAQACDDRATRVVGDSLFSQGVASGAAHCAIEIRALLETDK